MNFTCTYMFDLYVFLVLDTRACSNSELQSKCELLLIWLIIGTWALCCYLIILDSCITPLYKKYNNNNIFISLIRWFIDEPYRHLTSLTDCKVEQFIYGHSIYNKKSLAFDCCNYAWGCVIKMAVSGWNNPLASTVVFVLNIFVDRHSTWRINLIISVNKDNIDS